jgi:CRISPR-associated endoribonuclease Cas6
VPDWSLNVPYAIEVPLKVVRVLEHEGGIAHRALNALLYHWLDAAKPQLATFVHDQAEPKPFTVSPLLADGDGGYRFRMTLLEDEYGPYVSQGMSKERSVRVGDKVLAIDGEARVEQRTYQAIAEQAGTRPVARLRFESPTAFKTREMHYPLPDPPLVFASYHARWNAFAPPEYRIDEAWREWLAYHVAVSRLEIHTEVLRFGQYEHIGFVGQVEYTVVDRQGDPLAQRGPFNALADYATFCGTGHKTTQGLGQTRRVKEF